MVFVEIDLIKRILILVTLWLFGMMQIRFVSRRKAKAGQSFANIKFL